MQQYQFEKIYSQMEKEFGSIERGEEDFHTMMFYPMESNLLKTHRKYPSSNSRRLREAISLVLFDIKSRYTGEQFSLDKFRDDDNARLEYALLMSFDPFTNEELRSILTGELKMNLNDLDKLHDYYAEPISCLLRLRESVDTWEKRLGSNGYFEFAESYIGAQITGDDLIYAVIEME
ncbi:MAG: hypothetical protein K2N87_01810 [Eubacterium sp.]|nr:hypothetical protein [Eubacterium sp.]